MKNIYKLLSYFFLIVWLVIFSISAFWLSECKYLLWSYSFIGFSLVLSKVLYCASILKKI